MNILSSLSRKLGFTGGDEDERDEELEDNELEEEDEEEDEDGGSGFSFPFSFGGIFGKKQQKTDHDADEEEEQEEPASHAYKSDAAEQGHTSSRRGNVIHDSRMDARAAQEPRYTHCERIVNVRHIEESREIIKYLLQGESILLNLENIDPKDCGRVVDLLSGAAFALQGRIIKVAHLSYLLAPESVKIIEEDIYAANRARYR